MRLWAAVAMITACAHTRTPSTYLRLEETGCIGQCEVYTLTLYQDGAILYEGHRFVPTGTRWRRTEPTEVARLIKLADQIPAWNCERMETDLPSSIVTVSRDGQLRRIVHHHGDPCTPAMMERLELDIHIAAGTPTFLGHH
jgi:hypothetical protein